MLPVRKAAFAFADKNSLSGYSKYTTVQINPAEIKHRIGCSCRKFVKGISSKEERDEKDAQATYSEVDCGVAEESLSMTLHFDLVSNLEILGETVSAMYNLFCDLPTNSGLLTSPLYSQLKLAAGRGQGVSFLWGKMRFEGKITSFDSNCSYFNRFGNVLRTDVNLTMTATQCEARGEIKKKLYYYLGSELNPDLILQRSADVLIDLTRN